MLIPINLIAAFILAVICNWVGLIPWRRAIVAHWSERARLLWPVRYTAAINVYLIPAGLFFSLKILFRDDYNWTFLDVLAGFIGAMLGRYWMEKEIFPNLKFDTWLYQTIVAWGFRFGYWGVLVGAMLLMPDHFGMKMVIISAAYIALVMALSCGLYLQYLRWVKFLKPADERLQRIVNETSERMKISFRNAAEFGGVYANAMAFPVTRDLIFSRRLLEISTDEEVSAICAHELAHLSESKTIIAMRLLGSLSFFPLIFVIPSLKLFNGLGLTLLYLAFITFVFFNRKISQKMEKRADREGLEQQTNEGVYARALEKLYRENKMPAVGSEANATHPHLYDRLIAAKLNPDFPRPAKPEKMTWVGWVYVIILAVLIGIFSADPNDANSTPSRGEIDSVSNTFETTTQAF